MTSAIYERTQRSQWVLVAMLASGVFATVTAWRVPWPGWPGLIAVGLVLCVVGVGFSQLTVSVFPTSITVRFGLGIIRRTIALADVAECAPVRNSWASGWGIRLIPGGWMWNVAGLDAVELRFKSGGKFRIGTDDPEGLTAAIRWRLGAASNSN